MIANTRDERNLLLFLETQAVDYRGKVKTASLNEVDFAIANKWKAEGFIKWGRVKLDDIMDEQFPRTQWVVLSDAAWEEAAAERKARAIRNVPYGDTL